MFIIITINGPKYPIQSKNNISDKWSHKFGMRKFTIENNQFYLNNKPFYLKATFFEGLIRAGCMLFHMQDDGNVCANVCASATFPNFN